MSASLILRVFFLLEYPACFLFNGSSQVRPSLPWVFETEKDKKKRKEEGKTRTPPPERPLTEVKTETRAEEPPEKKKEKPKSLRTTAPSHAKFRSTGEPLASLWAGVVRPWGPMCFVITVVPWRRGRVLGGALGSLVWVSFWKEDH